jgi:hypothetical protein
MAFPEKITSFFKDRVHYLTDFIDDIKDRIHFLPDNERKRLIIICASAVAVLLVLLVLLSSGSSGRQSRSVEPQRTVNRLNAIPPQELFLPDEPDFIPGVVLERERRLSWTEQDASEYWQDPLRDGEEPWRERIEEAISEFMERIP